MLAGHARGALRERHGRDHRQELGGQADGESHGEQKRLERRPVHRQAGRQDHQDEDEDSARDEQPEVTEASLELGLRRPRREPGDDVAKLRRAPGGEDANRCGSADDRGAKPDSAAGVSVRHVRRLVRRERLARERRFLKVQVSRFQQAAVGRDEIAGAQAHDVAWHNLPSGQLLPDPVAQDARGGGDLKPEPLGGLLRTPGLYEVDDDTEGDHRGDRCRVDFVAKKGREAGRHEQDEGKGVAEKRQELRER